MARCNMSGTFGGALASINSNLETFHELNVGPVTHLEAGEWNPIGQEPGYCGETLDGMSTELLE